MKSNNHYYRYLKNTKYVGVSEKIARTLNVVKPLYEDDDYLIILKHNVANNIRTVALYKKCLDVGFSEKIIKFRGFLDGIHRLG